jgi:hypothetical protein
MNVKKLTVYIPTKLYDEVVDALQRTIDATGYKHLKQNTWILLAIKEKVDREERRDVLDTGL